MKINSLIVFISLFLSINAHSADVDEVYDRMISTLRATSEIGRYNVAVVDRDDGSKDAILTVREGMEGEGAEGPFRFKLIPTFLTGGRTSTSFDEAIGVYRYQQAGPLLYDIVEVTVQGQSPSASRLVSYQENLLGERFATRFDTQEGSAE